MEQHLAYLTGTPMFQTIGVLSTIKLYNLLIIREYTKPWNVNRNIKLVRAIRTHQFRFQDMGFWKNGKILLGMKY